MESSGIVYLSNRSSFVLVCAVELDASSTDDVGLEEEAFGFGTAFDLGCLEEEADGTCQ